jgi:zinc protease
MKKTIIVLLFSVALAVSIFGQTEKPKLIEKVSAKKGSSELVIPYEKYQLPNGLTVILHEDHSDPIVHVDVTYHVGSAREEIGKSGFAHFFEHMMFEGSDHVAKGEHFKIVSEAGGMLNGTTNRDRTNYFETVPSNQIEKMLWLESDRMGFLLDAVTQTKFENQRATVKNERGQNYDNRPYGLVSEHLSKNLYPYGHPYSWLTIGYIEELNKVGVNDLKNFFLRWYGPNNATLTIGGDIDPKQTLAWIEKYFGSIPQCPKVDKEKLPAPILTADRYISYTDNYAQLPMLAISYPGVPMYHKDLAALDILTSIIGQGKNSILYKNLVKTRKAMRASMYSSNSELSGEIVIQVVPFKNLSLTDTKKLIDESLLEFEKKGVSDSDLQRFKGEAEADFINSLGSVSGKVSQLASAQTFTGNPNQIGKELKEIQSVSKEDIIRVYNQYIKGKYAVILSVLPKDKDLQPVASDNYTINKDNYVAPHYGYDGLKYAKATDNFDRSKLPAAGTNPVIKVPPFWKDSLSNGIKIIGSANNEIPSITLSLSVKGGGLLAANDTSKAGLPSIVSSMLNEDTENYSAEDFNSELQKAGSSIYVYAGDNSINIQVSSLTKNFAKTISLLEERLLHPRFTSDAFERIKKIAIENIRNSKTQPAQVASDVYQKVLYGADNVRTYGTSGKISTLEKITLEDVQSFYHNYFVPSLTSIVVVGDISQKEVVAKLSFLSAWKDKKVTIPEPMGQAKIEKTKIYLIDIPKAAQSQIYIGYVTGLKYDATGEYYRLGLINYALGGSFNSRVNMNLREHKGWTYGARTSFYSDQFGGEYTANAGIKIAATDSAIIEFTKEIGNYYDKGITPEELSFTKASIGQSDARRYETNQQKATFLFRIQEYNLLPNFVEEQNKILANIKTDEINSLIKKYLDISKMTIVVVSDKNVVLEKLKPLGYEIVELDTDGHFK